MPEYNNTADAIKETQDKKLSSLKISLPESMSEDERLEQITLLSDFIGTNHSIRTLDFSDTHPINGGIPVLSEKEAGILSAGLEKNSSITSVNVANTEAYNKAIEEEPIFGHWDTESYFSNSRIIDKEAYDKFQAVSSKTNKYSNRNGMLANETRDAISDIAKNVLGGRLADIVLNDETIPQKDKEEYPENYRINQLLAQQASEILFEDMPGDDRQSRFR